MIPVGFWPDNRRRPLAFARCRPTIVSRPSEPDPSGKAVQEGSELRYLVAIPVFNEARTLPGVLREVRRYASDILVIDDGSTDQTPRLLATERNLAVIRHLDNRGYGQSLIDGFRYAQSAGYDWLITMDCDEQHEPAFIPAFLRAAAEDNADIISGSRYLTTLAGSSRPPSDRRAINQEITDLLNELLGMNITDAFCGFKAYRVSALRHLDLNVPGYGIPLQLWVQAVRFGLRIRELPVRLIYKDPTRHFGGSLDDPDRRLLYYYEVLIHELARWAREAQGQPALAEQPSL